MKIEKSKLGYVKIVLASLPILISLGFVIGILYSIIDHYANVEVKSCDECTTNIPVTTPFKTNAAETDWSQIHEITQGDLLDYFPFAEGDGIKLKFYHGANSIEEMNTALTSDSNVLEGDITLQGYGTPSETEIPIMAHPPISQSDNTLNNWLTEVISSDKAIKMDIKITDVIPFALKSLSTHSSNLHQPVWINADVVQGPNTLTNDCIDHGTFLTNVDKYYANVTLSLGWTTGYRFVGENEKYSWESMDEMYSIVKDIPQPVTFPGRAALVRDSWDRFLWLLEQSDRFSLTIWTGSTDPVETNDLLFIRDNFGLGRVFYDAYDWMMDPFIKAVEENNHLKVFYPGGNVLDYFRIPDHRAIDVTWAHRVNDQADLDQALNDAKILMLEADVRLYGEGTDQLNSSLPVMAHDPPALNYELTLKEWLNKVTSSSLTPKGIKLDFKSIGALESALPIISEFKTELNMPVWVNSDILRGPNSITRPVNATRFFNAISEVYPDVTISPGWTTSYRHNFENEIYTREMVEEMYSFCKGLRQAITFPVRASLTQPSIANLQWLLSKNNRYSLTVWYSTFEPLTTEELYEIYQSFEPSKVYFDLPQEIMDNLLDYIDSHE